MTLTKTILDLSDNSLQVVPLTPEEIAALPPAPPPPPRVIAKADIWRRCTDAEAVTLDAMLKSQPIRKQRMWADSQYLSTDDDEFPAIETEFINAFGAARAAELLA